MIHGRKRFETPPGSRDYHFGVRIRSPIEQPCKPADVQVRHVACEDQIPCRMRVRKSRYDARQRAIAAVHFGADSEIVVGNRPDAHWYGVAPRANDGDLAHEWRHKPRRLQNERNAAEIKQMLRASHPRADATGENERLEGRAALCACYHRGRILFQFGSTCFRISASSSRFRKEHLAKRSRPRASWS